MPSVVRLDKVRSVYNGHIESVVYDAGTLENGNVGVAGDLVAGERELRTLVAPADQSAKLVLINAPEINYDQSTSASGSLQNFSQEAGVPTRAYHLERSDIFSISTDGIDEDSLEANGLTVGNYVVAQGGSLKLLETPTLDSTLEYGFVGKIIEKESIGTTRVTGEAGTIGRQIEFAVIEVVQN